MQTQINGYDLHEMLGTKLRALFQRRRGRDLFDLYWVLTRARLPVVSVKIIESFQHYLRLEGSAAGRSEFIALLDAHLADRGFCSDTNSGSSRFSVANLKWLGAVGGHGDGEFAGDEVEHVDEVEGGAVAASLALDG